jgi:hypothetical protein
MMRKATKRILELEYTGKSDQQQLRMLSEEKSLV